MCNRQRSSEKSARFDGKLTMDRCNGKTGKGKTCKRAASSKSKFCWQHQPKIGDNEWVLSVFLGQAFPPRENLSIKTRKALNTLVRRGPAQKSDGTGYVYIFSFTHDCTPKMWKIGMTKRAIEIRMKEWRLETKHLTLGVIKLERAIYVRKAKFAERVLHRYFDDVRVYRYEHERSLVSIRKSDRSLISKVKDETAETWKKGKKHVEWFQLEDTETVISLMRALADLKI